MRTLKTYLITSIALTTCWLGGAQQSHAQLSQILKDYKHDRPFQYAPSDPWTRSNLFNRHTKHHGFAYNCDSEECKRSSPYIRWQTHNENDLPKRTGWWQRLNQTVNDVKQRITDGACIDCANGESCQSCQQHANTHLGCRTCEGQPLPTTTIAKKSSIVKEHSAVTKSLLSEIRPAKAPVPKTTQSVRTASLESLDTRIK